MKDEGVPFVPSVRDERGSRGMNGVVCGARISTSPRVACPELVEGLDTNGVLPGAGVDSPYGWPNVLQAQSRCVVSLERIESKHSVTQHGSLR